MSIRAFSMGAGLLLLIAFAVLGWFCGQSYERSRSPLYAGMITLDKREIDSNTKLEATLNEVEKLCTPTSGASQ